MSNLNYHNIGGVGRLAYASAAATQVAAGSGDATTTTGTTIDRAAYSSMPHSAKFGVIYDATLASGKTLSIGYAIQDSADGSSWADYQIATYATVATAVGGAAAKAGVFEIDVDLTSARRYVRINSNPDLNASGTDTGITRSIVFLAGFDRLPSA